MQRACLLVLCFRSAVVAVIIVGPPPPTPSNGVIGTYAPAFVCPTSSTWDTASWTSASYSLSCTNKATTPQTVCSYSLAPGNNGVLAGQTGPGTCVGAATLVTTISCALNCPVVGASGMTLMEDSISGTTTTCYYSGGGFNPMTWNACEYSSGLLTSGSTTICPATLTSACPPPTNARRRYRREDNMTALLRKRAVDIQVRRALD